MINAKPGTCTQCGHSRHEHIKYIKALEKSGFWIWSTYALSKLKINSDYCPEVELKLADINIY